MSPKNAVISPIKFVPTRSVWAIDLPLIREDYKTKSNYEFTLDRNKYVLRTTKCININDDINA